MRSALRSSTSCFCNSSASSYLTSPSRRTSRVRTELLLFELLQPLLHECEKTAGFGAVDQPMVVAETEVTHRPDCNGIVHDHRALFNRADAEDRDLRLVDQRQAVQRAEHTWVRDRESPTLHFFGTELLRARARREIVD